MYRIKDNLVVILSYEKETSYILRNVNCFGLILRFSPGCLPMICLHNTTATYVKIPTYTAPTKDVDGKSSKSKKNCTTFILRHNKNTIQT